MITSSIFYRTLKSHRVDGRFEAIRASFPQCNVVNDYNIHSCDLAIIQGWPKMGSNTPHNELRKKVVEHQFEKNKHILTIDGNIFNYVAKNIFFRYSIDGVFANTGYYFDNDVDPKKWNDIKRILGCDLKPWRKTGKHVLILMQKDSGWTMEGINCVQWCASTIKEIRKYTNRPIVVRVHPSDIKQIGRYVNTINDPMTTVSLKHDIREDLENAWCSITYNSSPGAVSVIEGIPVFILDEQWKKSPAASVGNTDISRIEDPSMPDREQWIQKIAMSHFSIQDIKEGSLLRLVQDAFEKHYLK